MDTPRYRARTSDSPDRRQRFPPLVVVGALALVTGIVLGDLRTAFTEPTGAESPRISATAVVEPAVVEPDAANRELAVRFYAALDAILASGDTTMLPALVHPDFVDHTPGDGDAAGWRSLAARTEALREALPGLRLTAVAMVGDGDRVVVYLTAGEDDRRVGDAIEVLVIRGGQVVERWGLGDAEAPRSGGGK